MTNPSSRYEYQRNMFLFQFFSVIRSSNFDINQYVIFSSIVSEASTEVNRSSASLFSFSRCLPILYLSITSEDPIVRNVALTTRFASLTHRPFSHLIGLHKQQHYSYIRDIPKKVWRTTSVRGKFVTEYRYHKMSLFEEPSNIV